MRVASARGNPVGAENADRVIKKFDLQLWFRAQQDIDVMVGLNSEFSVEPVRREYSGSVQDALLAPVTKQQDERAARRSVHSTGGIYDWSDDQIEPAILDTSNQGTEELQRKIVVSNKPDVLPASFPKALRVRRVNTATPIGKEPYIFIVRRSTGQRGDDDDFIGQRRFANLSDPPGEELTRLYFMQGGKYDG